MKNIHNRWLNRVLLETIAWYFLLHSVKPRESESRQSIIYNKINAMLATPKIYPLISNQTFEWLLWSPYWLRISLERDQSRSPCNQLTLWKCTHQRTVWLLPRIPPYFDSHSHNIKHRKSSVKFHCNLSLHFLPHILTQSFTKLSRPLKCCPLRQYSLIINITIYVSFIPDISLLLNDAA